MRFTTSIKKFESEDQRAEAKVKIAQITAQQKKFETRKKVLEEELKRRKEEEEEMERVQLQLQIEEQIKEEQERLMEEDRIRAEYELQMEQETLKEPTKKPKKLKKKKKAPDVPTTTELPQLKVGFLGFSENKNMFEQMKQSDSTISPEVKQVKVNKIQVNPFLENLNTEDKKNTKGPQVKVNKLKKNSFFKLLESNAQPEQMPEPKPIPKKKTSDASKKSQPEIKFESKKLSVGKKEADIPAPSNEVVLRPKVRGSKSIENPLQNKKDRKHSSTLSLFFDNTKEFFRSSKEKLFGNSKEDLTLEEELEINEDKPSTSEMQNYLLKHVLFDQPEMQKMANRMKEKPLTKEEEFDLYLDKEYKQKIEQYCSLLDDDKKTKKKKPKKKKEEKLPQIKMVDVNFIQEQLKNQLEKPKALERRKSGIDEDPEIFGTNRVKQMQNMLTSGIEKKPVEEIKSKPKKFNSSIMNKIKSLELAETERLKREKDNEERIQKLLEKELEKETLRQERTQHNDSEKIQCDEENIEEEENKEEEMKKEIWLKLEEELGNLEEEQKELESTEQLLNEEEKACENENENLEQEDIIELQDIKEEISERRKVANERKKVLQRFQHIFEKPDVEEQKSQAIVGSIHGKIENFLQNSEQEERKKFEDNVLCGVSDVMARVRNKFETTPQESGALYKNEVRKKLNYTALKFESMGAEEPEEPVREQEEKEWAWKNKTALELEQENASRNPTSSTQEPHHNKERKEKRREFQDLKYKEMLEDINAVKQRMAERDIRLENDKKMDEMNKFMDEIKSSLQQIENEESEEESVAKIPIKTTTKKPVKKNSNKNLAKRSAIIQTLKNELFEGPKQETKSNRNYDLDDCNISIDKLKKKIIENDFIDDISKKEVRHKTDENGLVLKMAEKLALEEKNSETKLAKAPKLLLRGTSLEGEDKVQVKSLEKLKLEQQQKRWAWKEKDMKELQEYIKSNDLIVPKDIIDQQKNLEDFEEEFEAVKTYVDQKDTNIIIHMREEKEREFNTFMDGVKNYMKQETSNTEEDDFKKGMQSYLDLIDSNKTDVKSYQVPQVKTKTLDRLKSQLFNDDSKQIELPELSVKKLPSSLIDTVANSQNSEQRQSSPLIKRSSSNSGISSQTAFVKSFFESQQKEMPSPVIKSKGIHPSVLSLKRSNSEAGERNMLSQLKHKLKTIIEVQQYIESHEDLSIPTIIESIHRFSVSKKEDEKLASYKRFLECSHSFAEQKGRSEEQQIFKDNILAYLKVIENPDEKINGTPKLKKHTHVQISQSTNTKKHQIENKKEHETKPDVLSPEEKRRNILKKYGFKDRSMNVELSDESDDTDDSDDDIQGLSDNELCLKYGLPAMYIPEEKKKESPAQSVSAFKSLLSKLRTTPSNEVTSKIDSKVSVKKEELEPSSRSTAKMKYMFEYPRRESLPTPIERNGDSEIFKTGFNEKLIQRFENPSPSPQAERKFQGFSLQKSSTVSNVGAMFERSSPLLRDESNHSPSPVERRSYAMEKSGSFSKFKNAFESGVGLNEDEDSNKPLEFEQRKVQGELEALRSSSKLQKMFRINRSKSDVEGSPRMERKLDEKTLKDVSKSRTAITNMFESQGPKVTFGGSRPKEPEPPKPKPKPKAQEPVSDNKKWVFDTIQKYFDVIVEEEDEDEEEELEDIVIPSVDNDCDDYDDDDDESDYASADEEIKDPSPPPAPLVTKFPARKISVTDKIDVASFFKKEESVGRSPATLRKNISQERAQMSQITSRRASFSSDASDVILKHFGSPVPLKPIKDLPAVHSPNVMQKQLHQRSQPSPVIAPKLNPPKRKVSIDDFVDDAAKQFDELTDGSDLSIDEVGKPNTVRGGNSCQNLNQLSKSNSSSKIRGLFSSVVHGSANDLNISKFKSNLLAHLSTSKKVSFGSAQTLNLDPGVDSSSEYSEYDD